MVMLMMEVIDHGHTGTEEKSRIEETSDFMASHASIRGDWSRYCYYYLGMILIIIFLPNANDEAAD